MASKTKLQTRCSKCISCKSWESRQGDVYPPPYPETTQHTYVSGIKVSRHSSFPSQSQKKTNIILRKRQDAPLFRLSSSSFSTSSFFRCLSFVLFWLIFPLIFSFFFSCLHWLAFTYNNSFGIEIVDERPVPEEGSSCSFLLLQRDRDRERERVSLHSFNYLRDVMSPAFTPPFVITCILVPLVQLFDWIQLPKRYLEGIQLQQSMIKLINFCWTQLQREGGKTRDNLLMKKQSLGLESHSDSLLSVFFLIQIIRNGLSLPSLDLTASGVALMKMLHLFPSNRSYTIIILEPPSFSASLAILFLFMSLIFFVTELRKMRSWKNQLRGRQFA